MTRHAPQDLLKSRSGDKWERIGTHSRSGVLAPLFSVYSKETIGIGDLDDLKLLIDWCSQTGNSILQLLPMNEVGSTFCPYDALSSFALEPAYISLKSIPIPKKGKAFRESLKDLRKRFSTYRTHVDYRIKEEKIRILWDFYFEGFNDFSKEMDDFVKENESWLEDFAIYKVLKKYHNGKPWYEWEDLYQNRDAAALEAFSSEHEREISFEMWVQWLLCRQLKDAKAHAEKNGVLLKGDLPILISRDSADVWANRNFFKLEYAAGAPPDMYCAKGQRWGMPTYNWEAIASDGYWYLKEKLKYAENFYDILRVDHVVGLFRIWSIPYNEPMENMGLNGSFDPRDEKMWEEHGRSILSIMLDKARMLLVAEDLGIIPKVCPETLEKFGVPGNDVQRWTKDWKKKHDFLKSEDYRFVSVAMLSTHDTTNWPAWWENEAGTVDEGFFMRKCADKGISYDAVKGRLFDPSRSRHGRLRWLEEVASATALADILAKPKEEIPDLIEMYENTFKEKEKLWSHLGLKGAMRERSDPKIVNAIMKLNFAARSIFCIQSILDLLYLEDIFKGDPYQYRINTPGTISDKNWSLTIPISLEQLMKHKLSGRMMDLAASSKRRP